MQLQRRYSVTGQTPADHLGGMKSPKPQVLDTSVQTTTCGLCEPGAHNYAVRTSSKRSATQLPSPSTPSSQELPTKIARLGLEHDDMEIDTCSDSLPEEISIPQALSPLLPRSTELRPTLLTLPPEIRHQIYLLLGDLILPYPLIYCLSTFPNKKQHPLASVSRLIRSEALAIFYGYNMWIIKLEYKIMYDAFKDWIERLGDGAGCLRMVTIAVRGACFKPRTYHSSSINANWALANVGAAGVVIEEYHPPDGDASFRIDLSEKFAGGKVEVVRNDGTWEAGESARVCLQGLVWPLWEKRGQGLLTGKDWTDMVDQFLTYTGWWF
ncbi:hypothetical protein K469DRAFT_660813 [Zopfia rhizophila CBS 207.26]|uniref:F-box domain-containing protein n=1 Tax=Zopfia rhizophila CBS 207.26 TaxID=1314779 RepID=A0A6A6EEB8_9PEZI|nr:hypothetical protein K469DRAFT_660813 [Zopfia rhizophila CBS 207.26]